MATVKLVVDFGATKAGLTTVGYTVEGGARTTAGVTEIGTATGCYEASATVADGFVGSVLWDTGDASPLHAVDLIDQSALADAVYTGTATGGSNTSITFPAGAPAYDLTGYWLSTDAGPGAGYELILSGYTYNAGATTAVATFPALPNGQAPGAGTRFSVVGPAPAGAAGASLAQLQGELNTRGLTLALATQVATNLDERVSDLAASAVYNGVAAGGSNTTIQFPAGFPAINLTGYRLSTDVGPGAGYETILTSYNPATGLAGFAPLANGAAPGAGTRFSVLGPPPKLAVTLAAGDVTGALPVADSSGVTTLLNRVGSPLAISGGKVQATVAINDGYDAALAVALLTGLVQTTDPRQFTGHALALAPAGAGGTAGASLAQLQGELDTRGLTAAFTTLVTTNLDARVSSRSTYAGGPVAAVTGPVASIAGVTFPANFGALAISGAGKVTATLAAADVTGTLPVADSSGVSTLLNRLGAPLTISGGKVAATVAAGDGADAAAVRATIGTGGAGLTLIPFTGPSPAAIVTAFDTSSALLQTINAGVQSITSNTARTVLVVPSQMTVPAAGLAPYEVDCALFNLSGVNEAADAGAPVLRVRTAAGVSRDDHLSATLMPPLAGATGRYAVTYTVQPTDPAEQLFFDVTVVVGGVARTTSRTALVAPVFSSTFSTSDRANLAGVKAQTDLLKFDASGYVKSDPQVPVTVGTNLDKTNYALAGPVAVAGTVTVGTNLDKSNYTLAGPVAVAGPVTAVLAPNGLDNLSAAPEAGRPTTYRGWQMTAARRFLNRSTMPTSPGAAGGVLRVYADDGVTQLAAQPVSDDGTTQTQGPAT